MRLIAQYPNVGNSGHIFLVPLGQMQGALAIGEKINTQMISLRKEHGPDAVRDLKGNPETICGQDFILASVPVNQVLSEKGAERVSHVWIALHGFDTKLHQEEIRQLQILLQDMLSKIPNIIARFGHLESNTARVIEVMELVEWSKQLHILNLISSDEKQNLQNTADIIYNWIVNYKWPLMVFLAMPIALAIYLILPTDELRKGNNQPSVQSSGSKDSQETLNKINQKVKNKYQRDVTMNDLEAVKNYFELKSDSELIQKFNKTNLNNKTKYFNFIAKLKEGINKIKKIEKDPEWKSPDMETNQKIQKLEELFKQVKDIIDSSSNFSESGNNKFVKFLVEYQSFDARYEKLINDILASAFNNDLHLFKSSKGAVGIKNLNELTSLNNDLKINKDFLNLYDRLKQKYSSSNSWPIQQEIEGLINEIISLDSKN